MAEANQHYTPEEVDQEGAVDPEHAARDEATAEDYAQIPPQQAPMTSVSYGPGGWATPAPPTAPPPAVPGGPATAPRPGPGGIRWSGTSSAPATATGPLASPSAAGTGPPTAPPAPMPMPADWVGDPSVPVGPTADADPLTHPPATGGVVFGSQGYPEQKRRGRRRRPKRGIALHNWALILVWPTLLVAIGVAVVAGLSFAGVIDPEDYRDESWFRLALWAPFVVIAASAVGFFWLSVSRKYGGRGLLELAVFLAIVGGGLGIYTIQYGTPFGP